MESLAWSICVRPPQLFVAPLPRSFVFILLNKDHSPVWRRWAECSGFEAPPNPEHEKHELVSPSSPACSSSQQFELSITSSPARAVHSPSSNSDQVPPLRLSYSITRRAAPTDTRHAPLASPPLPTTKAGRRHIAAPAAVSSRATAERAATNCTPRGTTETSIKLHFFLHTKLCQFF